MHRRILCLYTCLFYVYFMSLYILYVFDFGHLEDLLLLFNH